MVAARIFNHLLFFRHKKCRSAFGISSKVKGSDVLHHVMFDIDFDDKGSKKIMPVIEWLFDRYHDFEIDWQITPHGMHIIIGKQLRFTACARELLECPFVDTAWVAMGLLRGYWFLETRVPVRFPHVTYMRVER